MTLRFKSWLIPSALIALAAGCSEPEGIVPVAPPGFESAKQAPAGDPPQAIGETGAAQKSAPRPTAPPVRVANSPPTPIGQPTKTASGLVYETLKEGTGATATSGQTVTIAYQGQLTDGKTFDSSKSFSTAIGVGRVIEGWDEGVPGMKVGERRKLTIPPELGYKAAGYPPSIPPNATLIFELELLDVR